MEHVGMLCDALWNQQKRSGFLARVTAVTEITAVTDVTAVADARLGDDPVLRVREAVDSVRAAVERLTDPLIEYVRDRTGSPGKKPPSMERRIASAGAKRCVRAHTSRS